jgi:hypothetical protein
MDMGTATRAFGNFIAQKQDDLGEPLAPTGTPPERLSSGWAFYYQSRAYMETGELSAMLVGHGPVVISNEGRIIEGGSLDRDAEALLNQ